MITHETALAMALRLQREGSPYALVSVVRAQAPASARAGDKAVVTGDGQIHGWVGGGCAQPAVVRTVRQALQDGRARLIRITPAAEGSETDLGDVLEFGMRCHSGGTLELFVDPVLPRPQLVVIGSSPVAASLAQLAPRVGFDVSVVAEGARSEDYPDAVRVLAGDLVEAVLPQIPPGAWVVVATQGRRDLPGLQLALAMQARQISFVASRRKAAVLKDALIAGGADPAAVAAIVAPAGYPMPATTPEEIALSVLAATVASRRSEGRPDADQALPAGQPLWTAEASTEVVAVPSPAPLTLAQAEPLPPSPKGGGCCGGKR